MRRGIVQCHQPALDPVEIDDLAGLLRFEARGNPQESPPSVEGESLPLCPAASILRWTEEREPLVLQGIIDLLPGKCLPQGVS